jgi:hypothetical protein
MPLEGQGTDAGKEDRGAGKGKRNKGDKGEGVSEQGLCPGWSPSPSLAPFAGLVPLSLSIPLPPSHLARLVPLVAQAVVQHLLVADLHKRVTVQSEQLYYNTQ